MKMHLENRMLIIPDKPDPERDLLADAWQARDGEVLRVGRFWETPDTRGMDVCVYGPDTFCQVLAQQLGLQLLAPPDRKMPFLSPQWLKRDLRLLEIRDLFSLEYPVFVKPEQPKAFAARIYPDQASLFAALEGLHPYELVICSEVVDPQGEVRAFVLDGEVRTLAWYEGAGALDEPRTWLQAFLREAPDWLPRAYVVDLAWAPDRGWMLLEFNAAWGAGLNGCDPVAALPCILASVIHARR